MMKEWADLRRLSVIVGQHTAKMLPADHPAYVSTDVWLGRDQVIAKALVVTLRVIMSQVRSDHIPKRGFTHHDHPVECFLFDRAYKALAMGIEIRPCLQSLFKSLECDQNSWTAG
jgi:hypothetical protein